MFSKGGGTPALHPFEPTAANLLLFTLHGLWLNHGNRKTNCYSLKSCQRWLWSQRVDCGTDILSDREASSAGLLSPQLHTCPWKPFVYLVYVGSPRRCHQSERWEKCPFDTLTIVVGGERRRKGKKKIRQTLSKVLLNCTVVVGKIQWPLCLEMDFVLCQTHSQARISV